ncbi:dgoA [Symbiodinium necroappetens]|uniref:DgoA protein n=1 Tax=Symbiodinium necroappetens TaxID=1628268 RepID=A0A812Y6T3_9DINO|nr:dgoA [Symbiodinium necroappetens]
MVSVSLSSAEVVEAQQRSLSTGTLPFAQVLPGSVLVGESHLLQVFFTAGQTVSDATVEVEAPPGFAFSPSCTAEELPETIYRNGETPDSVVIERFAVVQDVQARCFCLGDANCPILGSVGNELESLLLSRGKAHWVLGKAWPEVRWTAALQSCPLVAILRGVTPTEAAHVGKALAESGLTILEVPLNSPQALQSIALLVQHLPNAIVGAGTVLSAKEVDEVHGVGGKLIVSPNMDPIVIRRTKELGLISFPGVCTPTEAFAAIKAGADGLKAFPGEQLPPNIIKAWRAVLPKTTCLMPVGGVSTENMAAYLEAGASGFGVGTALYQAGDTADTCRKKAQTFVRKYRELAKDAAGDVDPPAKRARGATTTSFSFHVKLSRSHEDEKWGFFWEPEILKQSNRRVLRSIVAAPGSPFDMWNHENPHLAAVEGDELVQVNEGGKSAPDIARELKLGTQSAVMRILGQRRRVSAGFSRIISTRLA